MVSLSTHLSVLGVTEEESLVYINALETNASTVLEYAQNTGIPRTTVYLIVDSLLVNGLLTEHIEGKRKKYVPASPKELISLVKQKEEEFRNTAHAIEAEIPTLDALYNQFQGKPQIQFKAGIAAIREVFESSLKADSIYLHFMSVEGKAILEDIGEQYYEQYMKKMIATKQIIRDTNKNKAYVKDEMTSRNEIVLLQASYATETDYMIFGDTVVFITYKNDIPQILLINDTQIAFYERTKFNLLFGTLQKST